MQTRASLLPIYLPVIILVCLAFLPAAVYAQSPEPPPDEAPLEYDEAEAYAINQLIMCPVCPAETIDQAQVPIARQMRQIVREMLAEGATREEILDFFARRYGQDILAAPPKSGFNLVAWLFPIVGVVAALLGGGLVLRSMLARRPEGPPAQPPTAHADRDLSAYLAMVDRDLALDPSPESEREKNASDPPGASVGLQREGDRNRHG